MEVTLIVYYYFALAIHTKVIILFFEKNMSSNAGIYD